MLNTQLWASFDQGLTAADISDIESNLLFLRDELEYALSQSAVEDISSDLDQSLHIYLQHFCLSGNERLSPWLIHDRWFYYYSDGIELNPLLKEVLATIFFDEGPDLSVQVNRFVVFINCVNMIEKEVDAVVWLSFLDYLASRLIYQIGKNRMMTLLQPQ